MPPFSRHRRALSARASTVIIALSASALLHGAVIQVWQAIRGEAGAPASPKSGISLTVVETLSGNDVIDNADPAVRERPSSIPPHISEPSVLIKPPTEPRESAPTPASPTLSVQGSGPGLIKMAVHVGPSDTPEKDASEQFQTAVDVDASPDTRTDSATPVSEFTPPQYQLGSARNPKPRYPFVARKFGWEGQVSLGVSVTEHGRPERVHIVQTSGRDVLDNAALETIRDHWHFHPAMEDGHAISAYLVVPVQFALSD